MSRNPPLKSSLDRFIPPLEGATLQQLVSVLPTAIALKPFSLSGEASEERPEAFEHVWEGVPTLFC